MNWSCIPGERGADQADAGPGDRAGIRVRDAAGDRAAANLTFQRDSNHRTEERETGENGAAHIHPPWAEWELSKWASGRCGAGI